MHSRAFLDVVDDLATGPSEAHWRTAVGRAYFALFLECREAQSRWGLSLPSQNQSHRTVRLRLVVAQDSDLLSVATFLEKLASYRARADYAPGDIVTFATPRIAIITIDWARNALGLLDQVDADPARRAAAVAAIKKTYP